MVLPFTLDDPKTMEDIGRAADSNVQWGIIGKLENRAAKAKIYTTILLQFYIACVVWKGLCNIIVYKKHV